MIDPYGLPFIESNRLSALPSRPLGRCGFNPSLAQIRSKIEKRDFHVLQQISFVIGIYIAYFSHM
jgi:hypothetical protein